MRPRFGRTGISQLSIILHMSLLNKWLTTILVLTGIFVSWEPGPELTGHSHPHGLGHELQPPHELSLTASQSNVPESQPVSRGGNSGSTDFHYHAAFDFSSETCIDKTDKPIRFRSPTASFLSGTNSMIPDSPFSEVEFPPLI